jgi:hypothetical protein
MTRYASALAIPAIIGPSIWIAPSRLNVLVAVAAGLICCVGLVGRSLSWIVAGGVLALLDLAGVLWWTGSSLGLFSSLMVGSAVLLTLDAANFAARFKGAIIEQSTWRLHAAWWIARLTVVTAAMVAVAVLASVIQSVAPDLMSSTARPILAATGGLLAFVAAIGAARDLLSRSP